MAQVHGLLPWDLPDLRPDELVAVLEHLNQMNAHARQGATS